MLKSKAEDKNGVLDELLDIAKNLKAVTDKKYEKWSKFVGACSYKIYEYFQGEHIPVPFMDDVNKRIDYRITENLVRILGIRNLLKLPTVSEETTAIAINTQDTNEE